MTSAAQHADHDELLALLGGRPIVLIGMMGAGKTTVGRRLAARLGRRFVDSDEEVEKAANMTIPEIFAAHGEADFRAGEARVIARILREPDIVLGTGGGAFINPETRALIKTDALSVERVEAMAKRLTNLEDYLSDDDVGDLPLDTASLVTMIGIDAADIDVITDGGSYPTEAMRVWVKELQLGAWFSLDTNGQVRQVQFVWCSERKHLHLFAAADGRNFLIQARRLAAYLQAGLLVPLEEEALTVRATRDALAKLDANPERLLG